MWSAAVTVTPPGDEPVSLEAAKEFCRIDLDESGFDTELVALIAGERADAEAATGTRLMTQTVRASADSFADLARLPIGPVQAVVGIAYLDLAGEVQPLAAESYELFGAGLERGIRPALGQSWPATLGQSGAVMVHLTVGHGEDSHALPGDLYVALLQSIRGQFDGKPIDIGPRLVNHRIWL